MNYSEKEMAALINEVETQFADHLKKTEDEVETKLVKSEKEVEVKVEETKTETTLVKTEEVFNYDEEDYVEMDKMYASMTKSEVEAHYDSIKKNIETEEVTMKKSEVETNDLHKSEIDAKDGEIVDLKKSLSKLTVAMTDFLKGKAPQRKAVTNIEYVAKSEEVKKEEIKENLNELSKKEISTRLTAKIRNGLDKSEREKINEFYNGDLKLDAIKHLL